MVRFEKQLRKCKRAVSDIIGNLLILAITVTLFSSIMYYVATMPEPQDNTFADISYDISEVSGGARWINLTHEGGQSLYNSSTNIYIYTDGTNLIYTNMLASVGEEWTAGEIWSYKLTGVTEDTSISVMIVDTSENVIVWQADLVGGGVSGMYAPIITLRYTTPSPIINGLDFQFHVSVMDPNGDLNDTSVYIDATSLVELGLTGNPIIALTDINNDGTFVSASRNGNLNFDEAVVLIYASDLEGHTSSSMMTLSAEQDATSGNVNNSWGPFNNYSSYFVNGTYPPDASGGQSTSKGTTFYYIRRASDDVITNLFEAKEAFYIEVYSNELQNLALDNSFYMFNPTTGGTISPQTKLINAFQYGGIFATFHRYVINLTAPEQLLTYPIQISLRDNTGTVVNIIDTIKVNGATYPILKTYKLNAATSMLEECTSFNHSDVVYLKIITKDVDLAITNVTLYDLQVNAYTGKYIIKQTPATPTTYTVPPTPPALAVNAPLTQIYKTSSSSLSPTRVVDNDLNGVYTIQINLLKANQAWWLAGKNSYTLYMPIFTDSGSWGVGETYYNMNLQFNVTAPKTTTDIVASIGSGSFTWSASGASWDDNQLAWFKNGEKFDQWERISIDDDTYDGPVDMCMVDVDNDGYQDVVVGYQDASVALAWYRNKEVDGSEWSSSPYLISGAFDAYPGINIVNTSHGGWIATWYGSSDTGTANEDVTVWSSDRGSFISRYSSTYYYSLNEIVGAIESGDFNGDGKLDLVVSFVHSVVYTSANSPGSANYGNSQGMFFNRGVYIFWNDGSWTRTQLSGTATYTNTNANPAALDLAVGDLNQDGVDDIVAVYETGVTNIWLNQWYNIIGSSSQPKVDAFGAASLVAATSVPTVSGTTPWSHTQRSPSVTLSDVDRNGYPDIIRSSTYISGGQNDVTVFRTMPDTPTTALGYPSAEYTEESEISAYVQGSIADLMVIGSNYETLTEVYKNTSVILGLPGQQANSGTYSDTTGQDINDLKYDDETMYNVDTGQTLAIYPFDIDSTYSTKPLTQVILRVNFSATVGYTGTNYLLYSINEPTYYSTGILPTSSSNVNTTYDLLLQGVDTWDDLTHLKMAFVVNGQGTVQFDYIRLEIKFAETRWMEWMYEVDNVPTQILHQLTMQAYTTTTGETFNVSYSTDDNIWYPAFAYNNLTETSYSIMLPHTTNSVYYIKVSAQDSSVSDVTNNSLNINYLAITHTSPEVYWPSASKSTVTFNVGTNEYITCLGVADVGSSAINHKPDQYADIVVGTSYVGSSSSPSTTQTIMIATGTGSTFDSIVSVTTSKLIANVGSSYALYNTQSIALGDYNGDGYVDIAITIGFAPGRSGGTAASVWLYRNEPLEGSWQWEEQSLNMLATGESAINIQAANVDISILFPIFGVLGLVAVEGAMRRVDRRRKK